MKICYNSNVFLTALLSLLVPLGSATEKPEEVPPSPVVLSGQIIFTFTTDRNRSFILKHSSGGIFVRQRDINQKLNLREGDCVAISDCVYRTSDNGTALCPRVITKISHRPLPEHETAIAERIPSGFYDFQLVKVDGIVIDAFKDELDPSWTWIILRSHNATIPLSVYDELQDREGLRRLVDAEITAKGCCLPVHKAHRPYMQSMVMLHGISDVTVKTASTADPFETPILNAKSDNAALHRRRTSGTVLATWNRNRIFLKCADGSSIQITFRRGIPLPNIGDNIDVVGFTQTDNFYLKLIQATWRKSANTTSTPQIPVDIDPSSIIKSDSGIRQISTDYNGEIIRIRGFVRNCPQNTALERMYLDCQNLLIPVDLSALRSTPALLPGTEIEATGVCLMEFSQETFITDFPRISGFTLITRGDDDLVILSSPSWWTPFKFLSVIVVLLVALVSILIWNASLRTISEKKSRQLFHSQIARVEADLRVGERTRLATELHDYLAQNLTAVSYQITTALNYWQSDWVSSKKHLVNADRMLQSSRTELRRCLYDLKNEALEAKHFNDAIRITLAALTDGVSVNIDFNVYRSRISDTTAHTVLSIIRELTSNAIQHGSATEIFIVGRLKENLLSFSVRDNGHGFDISNHPGAQEGHFGLESIHDRIDHLGGTFTMESAPTGTFASITIPTAASGNDNLI